MRKQRIQQRMCALVGFAGLGGPARPLVRKLEARRFDHLGCVHLFLQPLTARVFEDIMVSVQQCRKLGCIHLRGVVAGLQMQELPQQQTRASDTNNIIV